MLVMTRMPSPMTGHAPRCVTTKFYPHTDTIFIDGLAALFTEWDSSDLSIASTQVTGEGQWGTGGPGVSCTISVNALYRWNKNWANNYNHYCRHSFR